MATYFLRSSHISRGKGSLATRAAAYRSGERIKDERTGVTYDYSDRRDIAYKEVVLPSDLAGRADMAWSQDRAILWNAMEYAGTRHNSRVAREWLVLVPQELAPDQRVALVRTFAAELADKYRCAVDVAIHEPRPGADRRNHHAHLLMTTREVSPEGVGARTRLELGGRERHQRGLGPSRDEYVSLRARWAEVTNDALHRAGLNLRVDHRSLAEQGLQRAPRPPIPDKVFFAERKHGPSQAGDEIRARHRERMEARQKGSAEEARVVERQRRQLKSRAIDDFKQKDAQPKRPSWTTLTKSQRNEVRRQQYAARREIERQDPVREARRRELARQQFQKSYSKDPERYRQQRRTYRAEHAEEINRNQREYRRIHSNELNRIRREYRRSHAAEENRKQREYRQQTEQQRAPSKEPTPTALDSAKAWLEYRQSQGPGPTAEDSARAWLAARNAQQFSDPAQTVPTPDHSPRSEPAASDDADERPRPTLDYDLEL
jgi:hypothetical protein